MQSHNMLSAKAIAAEVQAKRLHAKDALLMGAERANSQESKLKIYTHKAPLAVGKGPLSGIAVGVKDIFDTHDMPTCYGSKIYPDRQPSTDAALVRMLKHAGATIAGKTVTTEFAWFTPGPTRNPHNPMHTPGGSSSGSAAGVAAGYFPAAIGSQTGGSIIRPAAFCGVSGFKPSFRLFPTIGMKHFSWSLDTVGFFAASAADNGFVASLCSGRDLIVDETDESAPRIGLLVGGINDQMEPDMARTIAMLKRHLPRRGAQFIKIKTNQKIEAARSAHAPVQGFEARLSLSDELARHKAKLSKNLRAYLKEAEDITPQIYDEARRTANHARKACHDLFTDCDVLLTASAPGTAPRTLKSTGNSIFNQLWTLMGLPCVNIPGLLGDNGLPLGVQIIAPFGQDKRALQAAHWIETHLPDPR